MIHLQHLSYAHPDKDVLFTDLHLSISQYSRAALTGNNGVGKSSLLKIIAGELPYTSGQLRLDARPYYIPQLYGQFNHLTIAAALGISARQKALQAILAGEVTAENMTLLDDDWALEERCALALEQWQLGAFGLQQSMSELSGGQKTRVFLAGIHIHQPQLILMDEPSNHLDTAGRQLLYDYVAGSNNTMLVVSHDRQLLEILDPVCELNKHGITVYGGNYSFYKDQKQQQLAALQSDVRNQEKEIRKAKEKERETLERQQRQDARGKQKQEKAGVARIMMNTLRNKAENSTSKLKEVHAEKLHSMQNDLQQLRAAMPAADQMKLGLADARLPHGKLLFQGVQVNHAFQQKKLWTTPLDLEIYSGQRLAISGANGSGKTTLIRILLGQLQPGSGTVYRLPVHAVYLDQDYSLVNDQLSVFEQACAFNSAALQEHEIGIRLHRFLFMRDQWDKPCTSLSGGERMRLILCCLTLGRQAPDMLILDEPTNNLDLQNIDILTAAVNEYQGTVIVVSHDKVFLESVGVEQHLRVKV